MTVTPLQNLGRPQRGAGKVGEVWQPCLPVHPRSDHGRRAGRGDVRCRQKKPGSVSLPGVASWIGKDAKC